jgi:hypothetical protein
VSLVKYSHQTHSSNGKRLFWDRAPVDGAPFRGPTAPILREEEYEARAVRVADFKMGFFDVADEKGVKDFSQVMECCANGWYKLVHIERFHGTPPRHYVEWVEYYMEDGARTPFLTNPEVLGG